MSSRIPVGVDAVDYHGEPVELLADYPLRASFDKLRMTQPLQHKKSG